MKLSTISKQSKKKTTTKNTPILLTPIASIKQGTLFHPFCKFRYELQGKGEPRRYTLENGQHHQLK